MNKQATRRRSPWDGGVRPYHYVPPSPKFLDEDLRPAWKAPEENFFRRLGTGALARDLSGVAGGILPFRTPRQMISESIAGVDSTEEFTPEDGFNPEEYLGIVTDEATLRILQRAGFDKEYLTINAVSRAEVDRRIYLAKIQAYNDQANNEYYKNSYVADYAASTLGFVFDVTADPTVAPTILFTGGLFTGVGRTTAALGAMTEGALVSGLTAEQQENYAAAITGNDRLDPEGFQTGPVIVGGLMGGSIGAVLGGSIGRAGYDGVEAAVTRDLMDQLPDEVRPRGEILNRVVRIDRFAEAALDDKAIEALRALGSRSQVVRDNIDALTDITRYGDPEFGPADVYLWIKATNPDSATLRRVLNDLDTEDNVRLFSNNDLRKQMKGSRRVWNDKTAKIQAKIEEADALASSGTRDASLAETRLRIEIEQLDDELGLSPFTDTKPPSSSPIERMRDNAKFSGLSKDARKSIMGFLGLDVIGRLGTGAREFITKQSEPVIMQLAMMVDTAGAGFVSDFADPARQAAMFTVRGVRTVANAKMRGFGKAVRNAQKQDSVPTKWELNKALKDNTRFDSPLKNAVLDEYKKVLDYTAEILTRNGKSVQGLYIPGGIQASVVLKNRRFWESELSSAFMRRWENNADIHMGVARRAGIFDGVTEDGTLMFSKTKVAQLDDAERAAYRAAMREEFDEMARNSIKAGLGENALVDLENTGVYQVRRGGSGNPVRTYRQGFDADILTDPRLREMFDEDASQFMSTYGQNTLARELFDRKIKDAYGDQYTFDALLDEARAVLERTDKNKNPEKLLDKIKEKYNWAWGAPTPNEVDVKWTKFAVDAGARTARAAYSGAWGVASGLSELPRAIIQAGGYSPRLWGETVHDLFRSVFSSKYRNDLLYGLGQTFGDMSTQFRRSTFDLEVAAGAGIEMGVGKKFGAIFRQWKDVVSGRTEDVYGMGYSLFQERVLATADAAGQVGVTAGGLGYVTEIAASITANAMMRNLGRNTAKLRRASELLSKADTTDIKTFKALAKQAGMGSEWRMLAALNRNGMLKSGVLDVLEEATKDGVVDIGRLQNATMVNNPAADEALSSLVQYMDDRLLEFVPSPTAFTTNTHMGTFANLANMFLSFPRAFYARNGYGSTSSNGQYLVALGVFTMGETLYSAWREFAYRGKSVDSLIEEWSENPEAKAIQSFSRVPLFGPYGSALGGLAAELLAVKNPAGNMGGSIPTQTLKRLQRDLVKLARGDADMKTAANLSKFTGLGGNALIWTALSGLDLNPYSEDN